MREIKFRAWDRAKKNWLTGELPQGCAFVWSYGGHNREDMEPWQQYTGLKDKNGEEIYEGDLLKDEKGNIGEVFFRAPSFEVRWKRADGSWDTDSCFGYGIAIGNIYETPDLAK